MKQIINWIKKTRAYKRLKSKAISIKRWFIKNTTMRALKIVIWSRKHAQETYDRNIIELYKGVRRRQAFVFKTKMMNPGRGIKHYKILLVEMPHGIIEVQIAQEGTEDFTKHDYVNKAD